MPARPMDFLRNLLTTYFTKRSKPRGRRSPQLALEALEDRALPAAGLREQYMLELINRVRQDPAAMLPVILNSTDPDLQFNMASFNVDTNVLAAQWATLAPAPPLA